MPSKILIVDGMNLFIRCFVVVPTMDTNGAPIGGITGFMKSLKAMVRDVEPDRVIVCWDGEGGSRRRRGIMTEYKEGRKVRLNREHDFESPEDQQANMRSQVAKLKGFLELIGVVQVEAPEVEADDAIALICRFVYPDVEKVVLTSDRDMLQLVDAKTIVYSPTKKVYWTRAEMLEKVGVLPENYIFVKALMGDGSDNIKGLGGIGEKTAVKLFPFLAERETTAEEIFSHAEANVAKGTKYKSVLEQRGRFLENVKLMQLSNPIISPNAARTIRISATEQKSRFVFTEFKLGLIRHGIQIIDPDMIGVFQSLQRRAEACK
jgi:5'-3' exonuclease